MLAITANWGLGDGSLADSRVGQATVWLEAIRRAIMRSGWGRDGRYHPVDEVVLVFAGDTFDWLLSAAWAGRHRPWQGGARGDEVRTGVALDSLRAARPLLRVLAHWARKGIALPAATPRGRPSEWAQHRTPIRLVVLAGDRDAWLIDHAAAAGRLGAATGEAWSDGRRQVRHGHDLDPLAHRGATAAARGLRQPTLGESLIVDLVVPFASAARGDAAVWPGVRPRLTTLSATRPSGWPAVVAAMANAAQDPGRVWSAWQRAVAAWHAAALRDVPVCETEFDALAALAAWLDQPCAEPGVPEPIRRLDPVAPGSRRDPAITAEPGGAESPVLACHRIDGLEHVEPLGGVPPTPSIVAIGGGAAGNGFIDAA